MDNLSKLKIKIIKKLSIIFMILFVSIYFCFDYYKKQTKNDYLERTTQTYIRSFDTIYSQYKELSHVIFTGFLRLGNIDNNLKNINNLDKEQKDKVRKLIYDKIIKRYKTLKHNHLKTVNIILPNNEMFLKFNKPSQHSYIVNEGRVLLNQVQTTKHL